MGAQKEGREKGDSPAAEKSARAPGGEDWPCAAHGEFREKGEAVSDGGKTSLVPLGKKGHDPDPRP